MNFQVSIEHLEQMEGRGLAGFFDTLNHQWLIEFVERRIAHHRVVRHIQKWLNAGVLLILLGRRLRLDRTRAFDG